jgi:hypothetical protein
LGFQFILDDHRFAADPRIQQSGHVWDYFANFVWAQFTGAPPSFYRPMFFEQVTREYPRDWFAWAALWDCFVQLNDLPKAVESLHPATDISHDSRVIQEWQQLPETMGLTSSVKPQ